MEQVTLFEAMEMKQEELMRNAKVRPLHFNDILFGVAELGLYVNSGDIDKAMGEMLDEQYDNIYEYFDGYKALINKTSGDQISIVSNKYTVIDNTKVLEHFENMLISQNIKFEYGFAVTARNGRKTVMELILPEKVIDMGNGDTQDMRLYITNSFDGGNSVNIQMGFMRHACSNMALLQGSSDVNYSTSHIGNANERIETEFEFYINDKFADTEKFLKNLQLTDFDNYVNVMKFINHKDNKTVSDRDRKKVAEVFHRFYELDFGYCAYGVFQAYTHTITHIMNISENGKMKKLLEVSKIFDKLITGQFTV